jgi:hypothetical protein
VGFVVIVHPDMPESPETEIPVETFDHWAEKGFVLKEDRVEDVPALAEFFDDPDPESAPADEDNAPEGDTPTSEED